jgi:hypothetical protein
MRYAPSLPPVTSNTETRQVTGLSSVYAVKPIRAREPVSLANSTPQAAVLPVRQQAQRVMRFEDRRKYCRRVSHLPVLVELRSGIERRHHNQREGDMVEHVDETV